MNEPVQTTIDGEEVPMSDVSNEEKEPDYQITISISADCDYDDFTVDEVDPDGTGFTNAAELVESFQETYSSVFGLIADWGLDMSYRLMVTVYDKSTGKRTYADWQD